MKNMRPEYRWEQNGEFVIHHYNDARPWASFFPGIAGLFGIPLWVFYVNRGQCIASVGIRSKDEAILEFLPANKAYQCVPAQGFRTFLKVKHKAKTVYYEPFSIRENVLNTAVSNKMIIRPFDLTIVEHNAALGLDIEVSYFSLPHEPFGALVRELTIKNVSKKSLNIELLDGVSVLVPYGVNNFFLKEMSRTIEAWMSVESPVDGMAIYKLTTDPRDTAQVVFIKGAHFYKACVGGRRKTPLSVIVDPSLIFGSISDFSYPLNFFNAKAFKCPERHIAKNKMPCAFSYVKITLPPSGEKKLFSLLGHVFDSDDIKKYRMDTMGEDFIARKKTQNQELIEGIMDRVFTSSGLRVFDLYTRQTYLDNVLRGGLPYSVSVDDHQKSIYVFSRKHGDLERDYNRFMVSATYFSEGEGNYRDVNQNRRCDVFFNTLLGEKNIVDFINLIQLDGYNPLVFRGERFVLSEEEFRNSGLAKHFPEKDAKKVGHILSKPFMLGDILHYIAENKINVSCSLEQFISELLTVAQATEEAVFGEGYWTDHWTYNIDLLESFYGVYPDRMKWLLFDKNDFTYYDTHVYVKPRFQRYVVQRGEIRQYHSIGFDEEKNTLILKRHDAKNRVRIHHGDGLILKTTLMEKLLCLVVNKLATLDPCGVGIEMEADKPNWYDALNGLPGLFGSSIAETFELKRLMEFLKRVFGELSISKDQQVVVILELYEFFHELKTLLESNLGDFEFWDKANSIKETYRLKVRRGVAQLPSQAVPLAELLEFFELALVKLNTAIAKSYDAKSGFYDTYFMHKMTKHDSSTDASGKHLIVPKEFRQIRLPLFLEGFMHALRTEKGNAKAIYQAVKKSPLYDKKLKMYKVNASLEAESFELGRVKVFTRGWLENESIWLHMEYKYLLELLKNNLCEEFYKEFFNTLIPFQQPQVYGRSIFENSSFIVSSVHPDVSLHGAGFVARLSGSTAELIHMWLFMNIGPEPFYLDEKNELALRLRPVLCADLFTKKACRRSYVDAAGKSFKVDFPAHTYSFLFLGKTLVVYHNPKNKNTFGKNRVRPVRITLTKGKEGTGTQIEGHCLNAPYAQLVRDGKVDRIDALLD